MSSIVDLMIQNNLITRKDYDRMVGASGRDEPFHRLAVRSGLVSEDDYLALVRDAYNYELLEELPQDFDPDQFSHISPVFLQEHNLLPLELNEKQVRVVVNDPFDYLVLDTLKKLYPGRRVYILLSRKEKITQWLDEYFHQEGREQAKDDQADEVSESAYEFEDLEHLKDLASEAPVIKKVNQFLTSAVEEKVSDIHIEPFEDRLLIRFRQDGLLHEHLTLPPYMQQAISTRLKIMARLDIAERRIPQDGRIKTKIAGKDIDIRVSCLPTVYGESVVMRLLDRTSTSFSLEKLGFPEREFKLFQKLIHSPYGILLVTGPTGSGKTTTLYSALNTINSIDKKIITIEDPVEYELDGINQIHVNPKAGLNFASGLRSIVRQDPDVILIGEIRDKETADIAIQSALTGHLVFSTLHTNDAAGAISRLIEIGVEDYLLASSLIGIMAQRLVRILCPECKKKFVPDEVVIEKYGLSFNGRPKEIFQPAGCQKCGFSGYSGRIAIFELMVINDDIREMILQNKSVVAIRKMGLEQGMTLLRSDGWSKVVEGTTSIEEVLRVTGQ
ncbi:type II secretion system ATPase GspE [Desulfonatronovibrio magnus]|uniref:type II secretion system ATPase GspE n=1 Tax=Desulfonatronovibrio magnus TaxID=698827 RepID=UPI0005EAC8B3|nr:type II secretion system ATPase GspE [Desulfonatronovibrio magnus]